MIAFVQPFGLRSQGGGARILRSLLEDAPVPHLSVCTAPRPAVPAPQEVHLPVRPFFGRIESTRFAPYVGIDRLDVSLGARFERRLEALFRERGVAGVHAIPHGLEFWYAFRVARRLGLPYVLNVHDDMAYNLRRRPYLQMAMDRLDAVWKQADGRAVISEAMGEEYRQRYGRRPYVIVTDGLRDIALGPRLRHSKRLRVYFMGAIHLSYEGNFRGLVRALEAVQAARPGWEVSLTVRGGFPFRLESETVPIRSLPWGSEVDVARDLENVDLLYLPLPFEPEYASFGRFSLSTKMVTYLGSGAPILYHGPADSAAARLLGRYGAAFAVYGPGPDLLAQRMMDLGRANDVVRAALRLAADRFPLRRQRQVFWNLLRATGAASHSPTVGVSPESAFAEG